MVGLKKRLVAAEVRQRDFADRDPLTEVGNRRYFDATMKRELEGRTRPFGRRELDPSPLALLQEAAALAESVRAAIALGDAGDDIPAPSASVGWAVFPDDGPPAGGPE